MSLPLIVPSSFQASNGTGPSLKIISHSIVDNKYATYLVSANYEEITWTFTTRYSCLLNLHTELAATSPHVPEFPKKKYFGNLSEQF